jgi:branched-chain amino acid transport system permease protein
MAIRDSESAAQTYGKHVNAIKTLSVAVAAGLAGVAGSLYAFYISFINVESFMLETSILLMAMVIIGGTGTLFGPIVGAALLMSLPAALTYLPFLPPTELGSIQQIIYGLAMVLLMMFRPGGLVGGRSKEKSA